MTRHERWLWFALGFFAVYGAVVDRWYLVGAGVAAAVISALDIRVHRVRKGGQP